jgi:hypothetical protein
MLTDNEIYGEFQENYRYCHDFWSPFVSSAKVYSLAAAGYTWSDEELKQLALEGREPIEFNLMRRPLEFLSGYLRDNLNSVIVSPVEGSDQKTADQFTKLQYYTWDKGRGYNTFLDACDEGFKAGISLCGIQMDYTRDFVNGEISFFKRTYNSFYLDPTFEKIDLSDCAMAMTRDLLDKTMIKGILPFVDPKHIDDIFGSFRDDKFLSYHPNFTTLSRNRNLMAYDQYYKRVTKKRKFLVDNEAGYYRDVTDLSKTDMETLKTGMSRIRQLHREYADLGIEKKDLPALLDFQDVDREFVELNVILNGQRVYCGDDKTGIVKTFPFAPIIAYMEPSIWMPSLRIQGIPATLYSNQRQFNKRHMKIIDMMDSTISTGFKYLLGSVPDPADMQQSGQNKLIGVDPENAPQGLDSVQELNGGSANPALIEYQGILDKLTLTLANINESVLGVDEGGNTQVSGRLAQVRIAQGLRSNRKIMDNIEESQLVLGKLVLECIQNTYSPGKVKRILGEEPTEQFYEKDFEQYDAVLKEGVRSKSQRDAYYYELVALKREGILDVPQEEIARNLPLAGDSDLKEAIAKQQEQLLAQQEKINEQELLAMKLGNAEVEQKLSLAQERRARVISDIALSESRGSEAEQNRAKAALDRAKTISEIAGMETDRLLQVAEFVKTLESEEITDRENVADNIFAKADQINSETHGSMENQDMEAMQELNNIASGMQESQNSI